MIDLAQFAGPMGGLLCMAFAMGAVAGWGFCERKLVAPLRQRVDELEKQTEELNDWMKNGMDRQLAQVRVSSVRVLGNGSGDAAP